ncbi:MAG TPA: hypothetical protein PL110_18405 [Candidatus Eremiobacteraeota bacterium]|nr:hypothetical protein [Candidatus Eremiobacteraeota bacterium]
MKTFKTIFFILIVIILIVWYISSNLIRTSGGGHIGICESYLKNIATALEMYATDNKGNYPVSLDKLVETKHMKELPTCPGPEDTSYLKRILKGNYQRKPYGYKSTNKPSPNYTLWCGDPGVHAETGIVPSKGCWPQYAPDKGIIMKP